MSMQAATSGKYDARQLVDVMEFLNKNSESEQLGVLVIFRAGIAKEENSQISFRQNAFHNKDLLVEDEGKSLFLDCILACGVQARSWDLKLEVADLIMMIMDEAAYRTTDDENMIIMASGLVDFILCALRKHEQSPTVLAAQAFERFLSLMNNFALYENFSRKILDAGAPRVLMDLLSNPNVAEANKHSACRGLAVMAKGNGLSVSLTGDHVNLFNKMILSEQSQITYAAMMIVSAAMESSEKGQARANASIVVNQGLHRKMMEMYAEWVEAGSTSEATSTVLYMARNISTVLTYSEHINTWFVTRVGIVTKYLSESLTQMSERSLFMKLFNIIILTELAHVDNFRDAMEDADACNVLLRVIEGLTAPSPLHEETKVKALKCLRVLGQDEHHQVAICASNDFGPLLLYLNQDVKVESSPVTVELLRMLEQVTRGATKEGMISEEAITASASSLDTGVVMGLQQALCEFVGNLAKRRESGALAIETVHLALEVLRRLCTVRTNAIEMVEAWPDSDLDQILTYFKSHLAPCSAHTILSRIAQEVWRACEGEGRPAHFTWEKIRELKGPVESASSIGSPRVSDFGTLPRSDSMSSMHSLQSFKSLSSAGAMAETELLVQWKGASRKALPQSRSIGSGSS